MTDQKYSSTPWKLNLFGDTIKDSNEKPVAKPVFLSTHIAMQQLAINNASLIVKAVNNHEKLIRTLQDVIDYAEILIQKEYGVSGSLPYECEEYVEVRNKAQTLISEIKAGETTCNHL